MDCNLTHVDLKSHLKQHLESAKGANIQQLLVPGASIEESEAALAISRQYPNTLFPTAGVHPYHVNDVLCSSESINHLRTLAEDPDIRAIGECGLDYSEGFPPPEDQADWFKQQLQLAKDLKKPLFLHERGAHADFVKFLKEYEIPGNCEMLVHCFTGVEQELVTYLEMGCFIGITGYICKSKISKELRRILHRIPLDRLVIETDAPYMGFPSCRRGLANPKKQYPNVPTSLLQIIKTISEHSKYSENDIALHSTSNAQQFLNLHS